MDTFPRPRSLRSSARGSLQYNGDVMWYKRPSASSPMERDLRPVVVVQHPPGKIRLLSEDLLALILSKAPLHDLKHARLVNRAFRRAGARCVKQIHLRGGTVALPCHVWTAFPCATHLIIAIIACADCHPALAWMERKVPWSFMPPAPPPPDCPSCLAQLEVLVASLPDRVEALTAAMGPRKIITMRLAELLSQAAISSSLKQLHLSRLNAPAAARLLSNLPALTDLRISIDSMPAAMPWGWGPHIDPMPMLEWESSSISNGQHQQCFPASNCCADLSSLHLNLASAAISYINYDSLAQLASGLAYLKLEMHIDLPSAAQLQRLFAGCSKLRTLDWQFVTGTGGGRDIGAVIRQLADLPQLHTLLVQCGSCSLSDLLPASEALREVKLYRLRVMPEGVARLKEPAEQLRQLQVDDIELGSSRGPALPELEGCLARLLPGLEELSIGSSYPTACSVEQLVGAVAGHASLTSLHAMRFEHAAPCDQSSWERLLAQLASCAALQSASLRVPEQQSWVQQQGCTTPQLSGRGLRALAEGACSSRLRSLLLFPLSMCGGISMCHRHEARQAYDVAWYASLADAMLLLGHGRGSLQLQRLSLPVDLGLDVWDLQAGLHRLKQLKQLLSDVVASQVAAGSGPPQGSRPGCWVRSLWVCGGGSSSDEAAARRAQQGEQEQELLAQQQAVQQQACEVLDHLRRMLAAGELLQALQRAVQVTADKLKSVTDEKAVAYRPGNAVQRAAGLVEQVAQEVPGADAALPEGWRGLLQQGLLLRQEVQHAGQGRGCRMPFSCFSCGKFHWDVGSVAGCEVRLVVKLPAARGWGGGVGGCCTQA